MSSIIKFTSILFFLIFTAIGQNNNERKIYTDQSYIYNIGSGYWFELPKMTKPKEVTINP